MPNDLDKPLNDLLAKWHRWCAAPARVDDSLLRAFDTVLAGLPAPLRAALVVQARNLACGAHVWTSVRVSCERTAEARDCLHRLLAADRTRWFGPAVVYLNARGNRIGESNPRAELTDHEVEMMLQLRDEKAEDGTPKYSYGWLAAKFECSKSAVQWYCNGGRRSQVPARVKQVAR